MCNNHHSFHPPPPPPPPPPLLPPHPLPLSFRFRRKEKKKRKRNKLFTVAAPPFPIFFFFMQGLMYSTKKDFFLLFLLLTELCIPLLLSLCDFERRQETDWWLGGWGEGRGGAITRQPTHRPTQKKNPCFPTHTHTKKVLAPHFCVDKYGWVDTHPPTHACPTNIAGVHSVSRCPN